VVNQGRCGHECTEAWWRSHRSRASDHSRARELTSGGRKGRGEHGGYFAGLTEAQAMVWRPGDGNEVATVEKLGGGVLKLGGKGKRGGECAVRRGRGRLLFLGCGEAPGWRQRAVTVVLMAFKPLMDRGG
jgi:hypothetical protein